jgi:hypothetical protein
MRHKAASGKSAGRARDLQFGSIGIGSVAASLRASIVLHCRSCQLQPCRRYFAQTIADFKNGLRKSSDPRKANTNNMIRFAANMMDDSSQAEVFVPLSIGRGSQ